MPANQIYIPQETARRMSLYLRSLRRLRQDKIEVVSSKQITRFLNIFPFCFRKDLSYFGGFGKRGVGYNVGALINEIEKILGTNVLSEIVLVGVGKLGSALLEYPGFLEFNLKICAAFDNDKNKIGSLYGRVKVEPIKKLKAAIRKKNIKIAILCVPKEFAQEVSQDLVNFGIRAILNFSPVNLILPRHIFVSNADMASELEGLIFKLKRGYRKV
jgi:redox-sensing transcriptional repressor